MAKNRVWSQRRYVPVCSLSSFSSSPADLCLEAQANGSLIAAAPDMLDVLRDICSVMDNEERTPEEMLLLERAKTIVIEALKYDSVKAKLREAQASLSKSESHPGNETGNYLPGSCAHCGQFHSSAVCPPDNPQQPPK